MAKKTPVKKTKVEAAPVELPKVDEKVILPKPPVEEGSVSLTMSKSDLALFTNLMSITAQTFENLAQQAEKVNDPKAAEILSARQRLSTQLAYLLLSYHQMPEPESRDVH